MIGCSRNRQDPQQGRNPAIGAPARTPIPVKEDTLAREERMTEIALVATKVLKSQLGAYIFCVSAWYQVALEQRVISMLAIFKLQYRPGEGSPGSSFWGLAWGTSKQKEPFPFYLSAGCFSK